MSRRAWIAFAAMSVIWGVPYLFIKIAIEHGFPPGSLAWALIREAGSSRATVISSWRRR